MGDRFMVLRGSSGGEGEISVTGAYAAPPGPDWGWRIEIETQDLASPSGGDAFELRMFNIMPEGEEFLAVVSEYTRRPSG